MTCPNSTPFRNLFLFQQPGHHVYTVVHSEFKNINAEYVPFVNCSFPLRRTRTSFFGHVFIFYCVLFSTRRNENYNNQKHCSALYLLKHRLISWNKSLQKSFFIINLLKNIDIQNMVFLCVQNVTVLFIYFLSSDDGEGADGNLSETRCCQTPPLMMLGTQRVRRPDSGCCLHSLLASIEFCLCPHVFFQNRSHAH